MEGNDGSPGRCRGANGIAACGNDEKPTAAGSVAVADFAAGDTVRAAPRDGKAAAGAGFAGAEGFEHEEPSLYGVRVREGCVHRAEGPEPVRSGAVRDLERRPAE